MTSDLRYHPHQSLATIIQRGDLTAMRLPAAKRTLGPGWTSMGGHAAFDWLKSKTVVVLVPSCWLRMGRCGPQRMGGMWVSNLVRRRTLSVRTPTAKATAGLATCPEGSGVHMTTMGDWTGLARSADSHSWAWSSQSLSLPSGPNEIRPDGGGDRGAHRPLLLPGRYGQPFSTNRFERGLIPRTQERWKAPRISLLSSHTHLPRQSVPFQKQRWLPNVASSRSHHGSGVLCPSSATR